jgi:hypothetical protein
LEFKPIRGKSLRKKTHIRRIMESRSGLIHQEGQTINFSALPLPGANAEINKIPLSVWEEVYTNDKSGLQQCEQYIGARYW